MTTTNPKVIAAQVRHAKELDGLKTIYFTCVTNMLTASKGVKTFLAMHKAGNLEHSFLAGAELELTEATAKVKECLQAIDSVKFFFAEEIKAIKSAEVNDFPLN